MLQKKKIIHLIQSLESGGCENMLLRTLPIVNEWEHIIITLKNEGALAPAFRKKGIQVLSLSQRSLLDIKSYSTLQKLIHDISPTTILTYLFHADIVGRLWVQQFQKIPVIPFLRTTYNDHRYFIPRLFEHLTHGLVKCYLANSEAVRDFYVRKLGVPAKKITVIPNGIDTDSYETHAPDQELRTSLGIAPEEKIIICVANLHLNKGHRILLEALALFPITTLPHLLIVGVGETKDGLLAQTQKLGLESRVHFLGKRDDVLSLLKISNIFVLPTFFEGLSNAVLEALAARIPVITTDIPENRQVIISGKNGILIPPKDSHRLYSALHALLEDPDCQKSLSEEGFKTIVDHYSLNQSARKFQQFLQSLESPISMQLYESTYKTKHHFSFGQNWKEFLKNFTPQRLAQAEKSLIDFLGGKEAIVGKTFVDVGCGSGLFSLAAYKLGAKKIISIDIDENSVWCAQYLHRKEGNPSHWEIHTGSALDPHFLQTLGTFDIVYSWGVLHHTGNMWIALKNVMELVKNNGVFYVALYNDNLHFLEGTSRFWVKEKKLYNKSPWFLKKILEFFYTLYYIIGLSLNGYNPLRYIRTYTSLRGMSFATDIRDWLGGYPYEYASEKKVCDFFTAHDFILSNRKPARSIGCNEFLFSKK